VKVLNSFFQEVGYRDGIQSRVSGTVIRGMGGMGKTTLAAYCIADPRARRLFSGGIAWINQGQMYAERYSDKNSLKENLSFSDYRMFLINIARQLELETDCFHRISEPVHLGDSADDEQFYKRIERKAMYTAKYCMCDLLSGRRVLIVLDDVWSQDDVPWFDFWFDENDDIQEYFDETRMPSNCQTRSHLLITTRNRNILPHNHEKAVSCDQYCAFVDLSALSFADAITLFLVSSNLFSSMEECERQIVSDSLPILEQIVQRYGRLPVAMNILGRLAGTLFRFEESIDSGVWHSFLTQIDDDSQSLQQRNKDIISQCNFHELFYSSFAKQNLGIDQQKLILCFASFCNVFSYSNCDRPWISFSVVKAYFMAILSSCKLKVPPSDAFQCEEMALQIIDILEVLGFLDLLDLQTIEGYQNTIDEPECFCYRIHHDLIQKYGLFLASSGDLQVRKFGLVNYIRDKFFWKDDHKRIVEILQSILVDACWPKTYLYENRSWIGHSLSDSSFVAMYMPRHLIWANEFDRAALILKDNSFFHFRMSLLCEQDAEETMRLFLVDLNEFEKCCRFQKSAYLPQLYHMQMQILRSSVKQHNSSDWSIVNSYARAFVLLALELLKQSIWPLALDCLCEAEVLCQSSPSICVIKEKVQHIFNLTSMKCIVLVSRLSPNRLMFNECERLLMANRQTLVETDLTVTTPNDGLVRAVVKGSTEMHSAARFAHVNVGPKESAINFTFNGSTFVTADGLRLSIMGNVAACGHTLFLIKSNEPFAAPHHFNFSMNRDGTISPQGLPHLVIGTQAPSMRLVMRDSPCRLIFDVPPNFSEHSTLTFKQNLLSHPGFVISKEDCGIMLKTLSVDSIFVTNDVNTPTDLCYHRGDLLCHSNGTGAAIDIGFRVDAGSVMYFLNDWTPMTLNFLRYLLYKAGFFSYKLNEDGSISPMHAPHVALGVFIHGCANEIITPQMYDHAQFCTMQQYSTIQKILIGCRKNFCRILVVIIRILKTMSITLKRSRPR